MRVGRAEFVLDRGEALEVVADRQFLGHAHAAVQLHGVLPDEPGRTGDGHLGRRHRSGTLHGRIVEDRIARYCAATDCSSSINMSTMRCCRTWETADRLPELFTRLRVGDGVVEDLAHQPDRFGYNGGGRLVPRPLEQRESVSGDQRVGWQGNPVERQIRGGRSSIVRTTCDDNLACASRSDSRNRATFPSSIALTMR